MGILLFTEAHGTCVDKIHYHLQQWFSLCVGVCVSLPEMPVYKCRAAVVSLGPESLFLTATLLILMFLGLDHILKTNVQSDFKCCLK